MKLVFSGDRFSKCIKIDRSIQMKCKHPPHRYWCGTFYDIFTFVDCFWIGCCDCGEILRNRVPFRSSIPELKKEIECLIKRKEK